MMNRGRRKTSRGYKRRRLSHRTTAASRLSMISRDLQDINHGSAPQRYRIARIMEYGCVSVNERTMNKNDPLLRLLTVFFNLPSDTPRQELTQRAIASWDSLAMVQVIADLQGTFLIEFDLDQIEALRSYDEIRHALCSKGVSLERSMVSQS